MATGHVERRRKKGGKGWNTLVIDYGEYIDHSQDPPKVKRHREKEALPLAPGQTYMKKDDAEVVLRDRLSQINLGTYVKSSGMTVARYLAKWLDVCRQRQIPRSLAPATLENYEICVTHFVRDLGTIVVDKLQPGQVQSTYDRWLEAGKHPRTVEQVHEVLHIALNYGVKKQMLARNVLDFVEPPHPKKRRRTVLTPSQLNQLLQTARATPLYALIATAAYTGLRRGELLGLRWENVDFEGREIRVEEIFQRIKRTNIVKDPKSEAGIRTVPLLKEALAVLRDLRKRNPHDLVFCKPDGTRYSPSYVTHKFSEIAAKAGFKMRLHDERHTFATLMQASGADIKTVQAILGHEEYTTTADDYTQVLEEVKRQAMKALGKTVRNARHQSGTKRKTTKKTKGKD